jgi:class 3 adenylate cyclase/predicted ATPase
MGSSEREIEDLRRTIEKLEQSRFLLGDDVIEAATRPLKERLTLLEGSPDGSSSRRLVTVLFADLVGYTAISEKMDAEEVGDLMNALWERLDAVIVRQGGQIDKHMGDSLMAVWGTAEVREDDAERAVRAGLALATESGQFGSERGFDTRLRTGINSGLVLLGGVGTGGEQTAMGDTVNVASRLQKEAPPGSVVVSDDVATLVRGLFDMESLGMITVRGRTAPVHVHLIRKALPRQFRPGSRGIPGVVTTMVGREEELHRLREAFSLCMGSKRAGMVLVTGEAGIGKSRLLDEFSSRLASGFGGVELMRGRASPETINTPRGLFRDVFSEKFGLLESDSPALVQEKLQSGMAGTLDAERAAILGHYVGFDLSCVPAVRDLLGAPAFIRQGRAALLDFFAVLSAASPLVVLLEDLHWSDDSTVELALDIVRTHRSSPVMFLCTARPSFLEARPDLPGSPGIIGLVALESLNQAESEQLAGQILRRIDSVPDELRRFLVSSAEGNPFYLEELVGMLIQDGVITTCGDRWSVEPSRLSEARVPPTLKGILQARLDGLALEEKEVLQRASVVGRHFWDQSIAYLGGGDMPALKVQECLSSSIRMGLIRNEEPSTVETAGEFSFRHALLRDVAYETVLLRKRKTYHARVAAWIEGIAGSRLGEYRSLIATHLELAGDLDGAAAHLRVAAGALYHAGSTREAAVKYEKALSMAGPGSEVRRRILIDLADTLCVTAEFERAEDLLRTALSESREAGDKASEGYALRGLGSIAHVRGDAELAREQMSHALACLKEAGDMDGAASCLNNIGCILQTQGDLAAAREVHEESLGIRRHLGLALSISSSLNNLGAVSFAQRDFEAAERYFGESMAYSRQEGSIRGEAAALGNLGSIAMLRGNLHRAESLCRESLALRRQTADRGGTAHMLNALGGVLLSAGDIPGALAHLEESLELNREIGNARGAISCLTRLSEAALAGGDLVRAMEMAVESLAEILKAGAAPALPAGLKNLGMVLAGRGRTLEAAEIAHAILTCPSADQQSRSSAERLLEQAASVLSAEESARAKDAARATDLEAIASRYLHGSRGDPGTTSP